MPAFCVVVVACFVRIFGRDGNAETPTTICARKKIFVLIYVTSRSKFNIFKYISRRRRQTNHIYICVLGDMGAIHEWILNSLSKIKSKYYARVQLNIEICPFSGATSKTLAKYGWRLMHVACIPFSKEKKNDFSELTVTSYDTYAITICRSSDFCAAF